MDKNKKKDPFATVEEATSAIMGQPEDSFELLHKYGTYNIQPTNDSDNEFPEIAQGIPTEKLGREITPKREQ